jgi:ABC-type oligopeptide transport system ATPase subunit
MKEALIEIINLSKRFFKQNKHVTALDQISLKIYRGETVGIMGPSGCGKSTFGKLLIRLLEPCGGDIKFHGQSIFTFSKAELKQFRRHAQIVFQDPYSSLNPRYTVGGILKEPFEIHTDQPKDVVHQEVDRLLDRVGLSKKMTHRYPHELSGGQRQRVAIARAIALRPQLIVLDEPLSALDVSIQAQIVNLLRELKQEYYLTYVFISHDQTMVEYFSDVIYHHQNGKLIKD